MRVFETGATRDKEDGKFDYEGFLSPRVLQRYAEYMHEHRIQADGSLRDSDNWQKGIPMGAYMKSLWRHFMDVWLQWRNGSTFSKVWEDALCAMMFNVMGLLHETLKAKSMEDYSKLPRTGQDPGVYSPASAWAINALPIPQGLGGRITVPLNPVPFPKYPNEGF